jgi:hypothetical protein
VVKLSFTSNNLLLEWRDRTFQFLISATRFEAQEGRAVGLEFPELPVRALIDTGASLTIINPEIAATCKLKQTGFQKISAVGGLAGEYPEYGAAIAFPGSEIPSLGAARVVACSHNQTTLLLLFDRPGHTSKMGPDLQR